MPSLAFSIIWSENFLPNFNSRPNVILGSFTQIASHLNKEYPHILIEAITNSNCSQDNLVGQTILLAHLHCHI